jgi:hypothetical protein
MKGQRRDASLTHSVRLLDERLKPTLFLSIACASLPSPCGRRSAEQKSSGERTAEEEEGLVSPARGARRPPHTARPVAGRSHCHRKRAPHHAAWFEVQSSRHGLAFGQPPRCARFRRSWRWLGFARRQTAEQSTRHPPAGTTAQNTCTHEWTDRSERSLAPRSPPPQFTRCRRRLPVHCIASPATRTTAVGKRRGSEFTNEHECRFALWPMRPPT